MLDQGTEQIIINTSNAEQNLFIWSLCIAAVS